MNRVQRLMISPASRLMRAGALMASLAVLLPACSGLSTPPGGLGVAHLEARSSKDRPVWIDSPGRWQRDHPAREYFVGTTPREPDQESGRLDSYENAIASIARRVGEHARSLYDAESSRTMGTSSEGMDMSVRRHVRSLVSSSAQAQIGGVRVEDYFWQKFWVRDHESEPPYSFYRYHVLVSLGKDQYEQLLRKSLEGARDNAGDSRTKALFDRLIRQEKAPRP